MNGDKVLQELFDSLRGVPQHGLPPVEQWQPAHHSEIDIVIEADGSWWHEGTKILRHELVRLFASILVCENDSQFYLVTPAEKLRIQVVDAPLLIVESIVESTREGPSIIVRTNLDDALRIDSDHRLKLENNIPYVYVRRGLWAKAGRNVYYQWIDEALQSDSINGEDLLLVSAGTAHVIGRTSD